jgi:hypothetical protein
MATQVARNQNRYVGGPNPSGLADVLELILDKGLVIDLYVRVSLVGIELLTIDARIVVASVDTYLRFAEAVGRMDISETGDAQGLPDLLEGATSGGAKSKTSGALEGVKESLSGIFDSDDDDDEQEERKQKQPARRRRRKEADEE